MDPLATRRTIIQLIEKVPEKYLTELLRIIMLMLPPTRVH